jgi:diguanylate cyclase (GGDEF)-like protein
VVRRLSLVTRFAAVSLTLVVLLGLALSQVLSSLIERRALESAKQAAILSVAVGIQPLLQGEDLSGPLSGDAAAKLDRALRGSLRGTEVARIKVWNSDSHMIYSADPHTVTPTAVANPQPSEELGEALEGKIEAELITGSTESDNTALLDRYHSLLEVYVPIRDTAAAPGSDPAGVFELYLPYAQVQAAIRSDQKRAFLVVGLGLLVLWLGLFRTVATASRQLRRHAQRVDYEAAHDGLTELPNRSLLLDRIELALLERERWHHGGALLLLGIDRFREVNDTLGHTHGDELIVAVGRRLDQLAPDGDTVARLGGDEFAVLMRAVDGERDARVAAEEVQEALRAPFEVAGLSLAIDVSAGLVLLPMSLLPASRPEVEADVDAETVLRQADVAMSEAKRSHTGLAVYASEHDHHSTEQLQLLGELRVALDQRQLVLHYQPKFDLITGEVRGVEALVRWQHPERGLLAPDTFVPTAERTGLINPLTDYVLDLALCKAAYWLEAGLSVPMAVNISARSLLDTAFPDRVLATLAARGIPAASLILEITETSIMEDPEHALAALQRLHDAGVYLSIDDFGTGYSSLAYLKRLPVDEIKIDRSFIAALAVDARDRLIVASTVSLGRALGLDVVAEGVEEEETLLVLRELGCDLAQGFLFGRPEPDPPLGSRSGERLRAFAEAPPSG